MINWEAIWEIHAPYFEKGESKIPLRNGKTLRLTPGPGFGDLSHPTTTLSLALLSKTSPHISVDIGAGSGILSIAAALLGAKKVFAYEIDPDSIAHAKQNIALNHLEDVIVLNSPTPPKTFDQLFLNMISSEQRIALDSYPFVNCCSHQRIVSGILKEQEDDYLQAFTHGEMICRKQKGDWLAYCFLHAPK